MDAHKAVVVQPRDFQTQRGNFVELVGGIWVQVMWVANFAAKVKVLHPWRVWVCG